MNTTVRRSPYNRYNRGFNNEFGTLLSELFNAPIGEISKENKVNKVRPAVNIFKQEDNYIIEMALPGVKKENVTIDIEDKKLTVKSNIENEERVDFKLREFNYANFERTFTLSDTADVENIAAKFNNGILSITIPTVEEAGKKTISVL